MNKQELIEEIKEIGIYSLNLFSTVVEGIPTKTAIKLIKQLDEPQPVKVPPSVAEKIEYFKKTGDWDLFQAMDYLFGKKEIREWLEDKNNQETFARAWLDGYEVEKEKRYTVVTKATKQPLYYNAMDKKLFFSMSGLATKFTRKQLEEAGFGWVFDCPGIEIEEVE